MCSIYKHIIPQVSTNGLISFGSRSRFHSPVHFSSDYEHGIVAPYWTDNDAQQIGNVSWEIYSIGDSVDSDENIARTNDII